MAVVGYPAFPLNQYYKIGYGVGLQFNSRTIKKMGFTTEVSYTYFVHNEATIANVGYFIFRPGVNFYFGSNFYAGISAGPLLVTRDKEFANSFGISATSLDGLIVGGTIGYSKTNEKGSGVDAFVRINSNSGATNVRNWISLGIGYVFPFFPKK